MSQKSFVPQAVSFVSQVLKRDTRDDAAGQQCEIENPLACRACVRRDAKPL
jgi:hypothetical protein